MQGIKGNDQPKIDDINENHDEVHKSQTEQNDVPNKEENQVLDLNSPIEEVSHAITNVLLSKINNKTINKNNADTKESNEDEILKNNNILSSNTENTIKISNEIQNIVQDIADKVISKKDDSQDDSNKNENEQVENTQNSEDENPKSEPTEINYLPLVNFSNNLLANINKDEHEDANDSSSLSQNTPENPKNDTPTEVPEVRTVIRRQFEKSDASVQFESTDDTIFTTSVNSPRIQPDQSSEQFNDTSSISKDNSNFPPISISLYSDEELHSALINQIKTKQLPPLEMREELINYARKQSLFKLMEEDYDAAASIDEAIDQNLNSLHQENFSTDISNQTYFLKQTLNDATIQKVLIEENHKQKIENFKKMERQRIEEVIQQHENQRKDFEADWCREETLKPFNKPSPKLFQIRRQQKAMAISHDFKNARQLKRLGDQLQKEESLIASRKAADSMRSKYAALIKRQEKEMRCMLEYGERRLGQLQVERDNELKANETHITVIQNRLNNTKVAKRPRVQIPQSSLGSRSYQNQVTGIISARTRSQFANYKKDPDLKTRLDIRIGDVKKITKPLTPTPRKGEKSVLSPFT